MAIAIGSGTQGCNAKALTILIVTIYINIIAFILHP
jgi:hypothetical protein